MSERVRDDIAFVVGPHHQDRSPVDRRVRGHRVGHAFHSQFGNHDVGFETGSPQLILSRRVRPRRSTSGPELADRAARARAPPGSARPPRPTRRRPSRTDRARPRRVRRPPDRPAASGGTSGAMTASAPRFSRASASSRARSGERVTIIRRPNSGRASNQRTCSRRRITSPTTSSAASPFSGVAADDLFEQFANRARDRALRRARAAIDQRRGIVQRTAFINERAQDAGDEPRAGVTHDGSVERRQRAPVEVRDRVHFVFVSANEHHRVAPIGVGERDARVGGDADRRRHAGDHLERRCPARAGTALPWRRCRRRTGRPT